MWCWLCDLRFFSGGPTSSAPLTCASQSINVDVTHQVSAAGGTRACLVQAARRPLAALLLC